MGDKENRFLPEYGELNKLQDNSGKHRLDISPTFGSSMGSIRKTVQRTYTSKEIHPGPYVGVVLRVNDTDKDSIFTKIDNWWSDQGGTWAVKVRIPEIHAHIPSPSNVGPIDDVSSKDNELIESHTSFRPRDYQNQTKPEVGDYVRVEYKNGSGVYLGAIKNSQDASQRVDIPTKSVSAKGAFKKSEPKDKSWTDTLKDGIKGIFT